MPACLLQAHQHINLTLMMLLVLLQGRTGPHFQDFNNELIEDLLARYPNLVRRCTKLHRSVLRCAWMHSCSTVLLCCVM